MRTGGIVDELKARLSAPGGTHAAVIAEFWDGLQTPVVEAIAGTDDELQVTFFWRDADAHAVLVSINRITSSIADAAMERIDGTDVWFRSFRLGTDWRGSYTVMSFDEAAFAALGEREPRWAMRIVREQGDLDPLNPTVISTHGGRASVAELPAAAAQPWFAQSAASRGSTTQHQLDSGRRVWVRRPAGDDGATARPVVILLDGEVWAASGDAAHVIDVLAESGGIRVPYLVMVDAEGPRRMTDLSIDGTMSVEIATVIVPWVRSLLPISDDPADVIVSGESLGGLTALKTVFDHPEVVGAALAQSSSLWQHDMLERAVRAPASRLFLTAGQHEGHLVDANRVFVSTLADLHHDYLYLEYNGGHDMAWWRGLWADGIRHLLG